MSVLDHSLIFTKLSKYAQSLVSNPRGEMSHFLTGISDYLVEECHSSMLYDDMKISLLMVHSQRVEETRLRKRNREARRQGLTKVVLLSVSLTFKTSVDSRRGFLIQFLQNNPRLVMIGCLSFVSKWKR